MCGTLTERLHATLRAVWKSVFAPADLVRDNGAFAFATRYGWTLIVARWGYYSIIFQFRDYHGRWKPFWAPPFGLTVDLYASLQRCLSLPFGLALMLVLAGCTVAYLRHLGKAIGILPVLNVLGVAYFLPFVLLQPLDQFVIALMGWRLLPIAALHTAALVWESSAAAWILSEMQDLTRTERLQVGVLLAGLWIAIAGTVWR